MKSIRTLLILGPGPSSSHTIGPFRIANSFKEEVKEYKPSLIKVILYGSLALTGEGHGTSKIIKKALSEYPTDIEFVKSFKNLKHPNTMDCIAYSSFGKEIKRERYLSIGGGSFVKEGERISNKETYPFSSFEELKKLMKKENIDDLYRIIEKYEDKDIFNYGKELLLASFKTLESSLEKEGILPGKLHLERTAKKIKEKAEQLSSPMDRKLLLLTSYAYAISEANACGEMIVTTPTCGAAGVVPANLYLAKEEGFSIDELVKSYLVGALVCLFIKENAGASGALLGCQSEIGSAASFAAASLSYLNKLSLYQIEYACEVAMEHFLGLTCDPVDGYVQIPCIERNGIAAIHAYSSFLYGKNIALSRINRVSFDNVILAMKETGKGLRKEFKETSLGGLAKVVC